MGDASSKRNLFKAATFGDTKVLESLSETQLYIALYHQRDPLGRSLLHVAASYCQPQVVKFLVEADSLKQLINEEDAFYRTPLSLACKSDNLDVIEILLSHGADVNVRNIRGETALHYAAAKRLLQIAELLVSKGGDVKVKDKDGSTPLHYAALIHDRDMCELFLRFGAEIHGFDKHERTPLLIAVLDEQKELVDCIRKGREKWKKMHEAEEEDNRMLEERTPKDLADIDTSKKTSLSDMLLRRHVTSRTRSEPLSFVNFSDVHL